MSGRNQHYLPRFLQRPFAFKQKGKHFYVHAHHRAHGSFPRNVTQVGQELDFYSGPEDTSLDDAITIGERQLAVTVHRLNEGEVVSHADIAQLVGAISMRTKAMREALVDLVPLFLEAAKARLMDEKEGLQMMRAQMHDQAEQKRILEEELRKMPGLSRERRAKMRAIVLPKFRAHLVHNEAELAMEFRAIVSNLFEGMWTKAELIGREAFIKALTRAPEMPGRAAQLAEALEFEVWVATGEDFFVLGDCGPLAQFGDGKVRLALGSMEEGVQLEYVFLPISPRNCIVGRRPGSHHGLSIAALNKASASLSHEFIVSHQENGPGIEGLVEYIGSMTPIASREAIFEALRSETA